MSSEIYKLRRAALAVTRAEATLAAARERRDDAIVTAARAGHGTTEIATAAELTGQTVRVLVRTAEQETP